MVLRELAEDMQNHSRFFLEIKKEWGQVPENCSWKMIISERIRWWIVGAEIYKDQRNIDPG